MWRILTCFVVVGLLSNAVAEEKKAPVRELVVKIANAEKGTINEPTVVTNSDELGKFVTDEAAKKELLKEVDFVKQKLLVFVWAGSGMDALSFKANDTSTEVTFTYTRGKTKDLRSHAHVFVLPRDAKFTLLDGRAK